MEMGKDFEKDCPEVRVTINQNVADYTVLLNHIEVGFARDNQLQIANKDGDLIQNQRGREHQRRSKESVRHNSRRLGQEIVDTGPAS